jgi:drug/metabolite transporter (DMT)-like permease
MFYLALSVICSVIVSILLKLARRHKVELLPAVAWNYVAAAGLTALFFRPDMGSVEISKTPWPFYLALAVLLPGIFVAVGQAVRHAGIVRTDVAQRMSLLISLTAAFVVFREAISSEKALGIALGFVAIFCCIGWQKKSETREDRFSWLYLLLVFIGYGLIDICLKQISAAKTVSFAQSLFIMFVVAGSVAWLAWGRELIARRSQFSLRNCAGGLLLGAFNFGNILFYVRGHQALPENPALVFLSMNIGVIVLGTLVGVALFREKLSKINMLGIALAIIAVYVLFRDLLT